MSANVTSLMEPPRPRATRRVLLIAGMGYGLLFGLGYVLFVWGYDALLRGTHAAAVAWGVLFLGTVTALVIGGLAGFVGKLSPGLGVTVAAWCIASGLLGWITGRLPFVGASWMAGLRDSRFSGLEILTQLQSNQSRTLLLILANVIIGIVVGYVQTAAVDRAWDHTTTKGRMGWRSWLALALGILVAILPAAAANWLVMQPQRNAQLRLAEFVAVVLEEGVAGAEAHGLNITEAQRHGARLTEDYTIYFTGFYTEGDALYSSYADVVFGDGFALRCIVMGTRVGFCIDLAAKLETWVEDLSHAGATGAQRWLDNPMKTFVVEDDVVAWLRAQGEHLIGNFTVERLAQVNSWMLVRVQYDSGFAMECRFHGAAVVNVDQCRVAESRR